MNKDVNLAAAAIICLVPLTGFTLAATQPIPTASPPPINALYGDYTPFSDTTYGSPQAGSFRYGTLGGPVAITGAKLIGPNGASFSIIGNTCTGGIILQGKVTCEVDVRFHPQASGYLDESIELATNLGPFDQDIGANGVAAPILVSPTKIDFGFQQVGTSATRNVTLTNPNPYPVGYDYTYYTPQFDQAYGLFTNCGILPAGGSCTYQIQFTPQYAGTDSGLLYLITYLDAGGGNHLLTGVRLTGDGIADGISAVDLTKSYNVAGIDNDSAHVLAGGLDQLGNVYASEFLTNPLFANGQLFQLGTAHALDATSGASIPVTPGNYFGISLLATAVRGNQTNQPFVIYYSDGTSITERQSLSDWRTPQKYAGESVAVTTPYRLTSDGMRKNGPYDLYTYTLPVDHTKKVVSFKLPASRSVAVFAMNLNSIGVPVSVELSPLYNVPAITEPEPIPTSDGGIDGLNNTIDINEIINASSDLGALGTVPDYKANAVANVTVPLPTGIFGSLRLLGTAVRGNYANQTVIVNYKDGTNSVLHQSFSDWHTAQTYANESIALAMTHRLTPNGVQKGVYNIYQYDLPINSGKTVDSLVLPATRNVVILQVTLEP
jgi:hypothetical protein